jgi:hypothetical protein
MGDHHLRRASWRARGSSAPSPLLPPAHFLQDAPWYNTILWDTSGCCNMYTNDFWSLVRALFGYTGALAPAAAHSCRWAEGKRAPAARAAAVPQNPACLFLLEHPGLAAQHGRRPHSWQPVTWWLAEGQGSAARACSRFAAPAGPRYRCPLPSPSLQTSPPP